METKTKKFKTIHILEAVLGKQLITDLTYKGAAEVILFMSKVEASLDDVTWKHFVNIYNANHEIFVASLVEQYPQLGECFKNIKKEKDSSSSIWLPWASQTIELVGEELELNTPKYVIPIPPEFSMN